MITYRLVQSRFRVKTFIINGGVLNRNAELGVYCYDDTGVYVYCENSIKRFILEHESSINLLRKRALPLRVKQRSLGVPIN